MPDTSSDDLFELLIDLYQTIKVRSEEDLKNLDEDTYNKEKDELRFMSPISIANYIKENVEMISRIREEDLRKIDESEPNLNDVEKLEEQLQKCEDDIRILIKERYEEQLYKDLLEEHNGELENEIDELKRQLKESKKRAERYKEKAQKEEQQAEKLRDFQLENGKLKKEIENLKEKLKKTDKPEVSITMKKIRNLSHTRLVDQPSFGDISVGPKSIRLNMLANEKALGAKVIKINSVSKEKRNLSNLSEIDHSKSKSVSSNPATCQESYQPREKY